MNEPIFGQFSQSDNNHVVANIFFDLKSNLDNCDLLTFDTQKSINELQFGHFLTLHSLFYTKILENNAFMSRFDQGPPGEYPLDQDIELNNFIYASIKNIYNSYIEWANKIKMI